MRHVVDGNDIVRRLRQRHKHRPEPNRVAAQALWDEFDAAMAATIEPMVADDDVVATFDRVGWLAAKLAERFATVECERDEAIAEKTRAILRATAKGYAAGESATGKYWRERAEQAEAAFYVAKATLMSQSNHSPQPLLDQPSMKAPATTDRLVPVLAYLTDQEFGYDHWRATQFLAPEGAQPALLVICASNREREAVIEHLARTGLIRPADPEPR